jgi:FAS-associated factor 2
VFVQLEGPLSPAELVEILQTTLEEQGLAFGSAKAKRHEKILADRRLREEQDAAYFKALQLDKVVQVYMDSLGFGNPSASMHQIV